MVFDDAAKKNDGKLTGFDGSRMHKSGRKSNVLETGGELAIK